MPGRRSFFVVSIGLVISVVAGVAVVRCQRPVGLADELGWREAATPAMATREARGRPAPDRRLHGAARPALCRVRRPGARDPRRGPRPARLGGDVGIRRVDIGRGRRSGSTCRRPEPRPHRGAASRGRRGIPCGPLRNGDLARLRCRRERHGLRPPRPAVGRARGRADRAGATDRRRPAYRRRRRSLARVCLDPRLPAVESPRVRARSDRRDRPPPPGDHGPTARRADFDRQALERLQAFEIDIALRGIDCDAGVRPTLESVRLEYEARFVEAHRAILDDIKARARMLDAELGLTPAPSPDPVSFEP